MQQEHTNKLKGVLQGWQLAIFIAHLKAAAWSRKVIKRHMRGVKGQHRLFCRPQGTFGILYLIRIFTSYKQLKKTTAKRKLDPENIFFPQAISNCLLTTLGKKKLHPPCNVCSGGISS